MAAGLTDQVWTMEDLLHYRVLPAEAAPSPRQTDDSGRARTARRGRAKAPPTEVAA